MTYAISEVVQVIYPAIVQRNAGAADSFADDVPSAGIVPSHAAFAPAPAAGEGTGGLHRRPTNAAAAAAKAALLDFYRAIGDRDGLDARVDRIVTRYTLDSADAQQRRRGCDQLLSRLRKKYGAELATSVPLGRLAAALGGGGGFSSGGSGDGAALGEKQEGGGIGVLTKVKFGLFVLLSAYVVWTFFL